MPRKQRRAITARATSPYCRPVRVFAVLSAGLIGYSLARLLPAESLDAYGWRFALLVGVLVVPIGLLIRKRSARALGKSCGAGSSRTGGTVALAGVLRGLMNSCAGTIAGYGLTYLATYGPGHA